MPVLLALSLPSDGLTLAVLASFVLFGLAVARAHQGQGARLAALEEGLEGPEPPPAYRPLPLRGLTPPHEDRQPALGGVLLPGGLMAWTGESPAGSVLQALLDARDGPCAYLGAAPDEVARHLARSERVRANLYVPPPSADPARVLEERLDRGDLPGLPWVVADGSCPVEALKRLHRRFGCPVLLLCRGPVPPGFLALPEAR